MLPRCAHVGEQEISLDSSYLLQAENGIAQCSWTTVICPQCLMVAAMPDH